MKKFIKDNWKFLLLVLLGGLIGGYCIGLYGYDSLSEELLKQFPEVIDELAEAVNGTVFWEKPLREARRG